MYEPNDIGLIQFVMFAMDVESDLFTGRYRKSIGIPSNAKHLLLADPSIFNPWTRPAFVTKQFRRPSGMPRVSSRRSRARLHCVLRIFRL